MNAKSTMPDVQCAEKTRSTQLSQRIRFARILGTCRFGVLVDVEQLFRCFKMTTVFNTWSVPLSLKPDGCLALQEAETEQTERSGGAEHPESSSEDDMRALWREMQALTGSVKRILQILFLFRCSPTEILRCRKRRTALD